MRRKRKVITISYWANPNLPNKYCHKDKFTDNLIMKRNRKFPINNHMEAWSFLEECLKPITTLQNILWAFPKKTAIEILDILKENTSQEVFTFEEIEQARNILA